MRTKNKDDQLIRRSCRHLCPPEAVPGQREVCVHRISLSLLHKFILVCLFFKKKHFPLFVTGQSKPSVSSRSDDSFVTPQKSRKSKKPVITFSSDEEEDEEGEWKKHTFSLKWWFFPPLICLYIYVKPNTSLWALSPLSILSDQLPNVLFYHWKSQNNWSSK